MGACNDSCATLVIGVSLASIRMQGWPSQRGPTPRWRAKVMGGLTLAATLLLTMMALVARAAAGLGLAVVIVLVAFAASAQPQAPAAIQPAATATTGLALPAPLGQGRSSLEATLAQRRSLRDFATTPLTAVQTGQLLWAAQGLTGAKGSAPGRRTVPSAGATYPVVLYLVAGRIDGVASGVYRYLPQAHRLDAVAQGDLRAEVATAARGQRWIADAPALVVIAAQPARTVARYGALAERYVAMEVGAAAQNLLLQAVALGLGGTLVGAFDEAALRRSLALGDNEQPLAIVPVGHKR